MAARRGWALTALAAILVITAGWWALALWPLPAEGADWLIRTRVACFGRTPSGLPDGGGWLLLFGQPLGMLAFLLAGWGGTVRAGLVALGRRPSGRILLGAVAVALATGIVATARRLAAAGSGTLASVPVADTPRLAATPASLALRGQDGAVHELAEFAGRPVVVTFAYAHCETVCPLVVQDVLRAARAARPRPAVLIVSLDPWRDTPARLPSIAARWNLGDGEFVLSGSVAQVEAVLAGWGIGIARDPQTGDIVHPRVAWVVDAAGRVAFAGDGRPDQLARQLARL